MSLRERLNIPTRQEVKTAKSTIDKLEKRREQRKKRKKKLGSKDQTALEEASMTRRRFNRIFAAGAVTVAGVSAGVTSAIWNLLSTEENSDNPQTSHDTQRKPKPGERLVRIVDPKGLRIELDLEKEFGPETIQAIKDTFNLYHSHYGFEEHVNLFKWDTVDKGGGHMVPEYTEGRNMWIDPQFFNHKFFTGHKIEVIKNVVLHALTHAQRPKNITTIDRPFKTLQGLEAFGFHGLTVRAKSKSGKIKSFPLFEESACEALAFYANPKYSPPSPKYKRMGQITINLLKKTGLQREKIKQILINMVRTNDVLGFLRLITGIKDPKPADIQKAIEWYMSKKPVAEIEKEVSEYKLTRNY